MIRCSGFRPRRKTIPDASRSGSDSKGESVSMFSMLAAEVFSGWTSVGFEAPGLLRLSGARSNRKTIANVVDQRLRFEVRVALALFSVSGFFYVDGPPWKTS